MQKLKKLVRGDKVAVVSPSFAAPGLWPHVHKLGLERLTSIFGLVPVEYPATAKLGASWQERASDLQSAFENPEIKAVIATLGGDDQVTYIKKLPSASFRDNPKPFFGFSDNSHFANFLFLNNVPSYYGASLFTQFALQGEMDEYSVKYIHRALFDEGEFELVPSEKYNDEHFDWGDTTLLTVKNTYSQNDGFVWDGSQNGEGLLWGGCIESVDEMLRHGVVIPTLEQFKTIVLMLESSEEIPPADYVFRVMRALGERGILEAVQGVVVGRAKAWDSLKQNTPAQKEVYRREQQEAIQKEVRKYNPNIPLVQNIDFGHTNPQIPMPYGNTLRIDVENKKLFATF